MGINLIKTQHFVANQLLAKNINTTKSLHFWRTLDKAEIDFVQVEGESILPVEVKYSQLKKPPLPDRCAILLKNILPKLPGW